jgi:hypothetical protein
MRTLGYLIVIVLLISFSAQAQSVSRFYENGKVGYKNASGQVVIPATYYAGSEMMQLASGGNYAIVVKDRKRGYIDDRGNAFIPFIYEDASVFSYNLARVMMNGKNGFINANGETLIPFIYDFAGDFNNGLARVQKDNRWGFIDVRGNAVIPIQYESVGDFANGLAPVKLPEGKWGFISQKGKVMLQPKYELAESFMNGEAVVKLNDEFYLINTSGKKLREIKRAEEEENKHSKK